MNTKTTIGTLFVLTALLLQSFMVPQPAAASACDAAQFIADVTIPDGTTLSPGQAFTKTWLLKNVGTCTWNTSYKLVFSSGNQLGAPATINFPNSVAPGGSINLSVTMVAPANSGSYFSYWKLRNANGVSFGIGATADRSFWAQISVKTGGGTTTGFDFVQNAPNAIWSSGAGTLAFPGSTGNTSGAGLRVDNPTLESGVGSNAGALLMVPQNVTNGYVQAEFPSYHVQSGDHFQSIINCAFQATACFVTFRIDYKLGSSSTVYNLWSFNERYDGLYYSADRDLSSLVGQDVKFILRIGAVGSPVGDQALWVGPRIINGSGVIPTVTGTPPTPTSTTVPISSCDRGTFIADFNVPDGTVFGPNAAFTKTWSIKNTGACTWTTAYKLVFVSGDQLGGPLEQNFVSTVGPNTTVQISVGLTSPGANGHYRGFWMLKNASGALFGIGPGGNKPFWVDIVVTGGNNFTATPTVTGTPPTPTPTSNGPTATPTPNFGPDRAAFVADISVPDGSGFGPNASFTKTWRLMNTGSSTWTTSYKLVFASGNQMSGPSEQNLASSVSPGHTIDISVGLKAPSLGGTYRGYWMLKNAAGQLFGIGSTANRPFWVDIFVTGSAATSTATSTATGTKTGVPGTGTPTATVTLTPVPGTATVTRTVTPTSTVTPTPTVTSQSAGSYAVVEITKSDGTLNVRSGAGVSNPLIGTLPYTANNIVRMGSPITVGSAEWWQVQQPGVITGWVNAFYLTEYKPSAEFCADTNVSTLLSNLGTAFKNSDGAALAAMASPKHGLDIRLVSSNTPANYTPALLASIFTSTTVVNWGPAPASGQVVSGTFSDVMLPKLQDVYNSTPTATCNDTSKVGAVSNPWPSEYTSINFYSIYKPATTSGGQDWRDLLVGIEYVNGQPYVFSIVNFEWVP